MELSEQTIIILPYGCVTLYNPSTEHRERGDVHRAVRHPLLLRRPRPRRTQLRRMGQGTLLI